MAQRHAQVERALSRPYSFGSHSTKRDSNRVTNADSVSHKLAGCSQMQGPYDREIAGPECGIEINRSVIRYGSALLRKTILLHALNGDERGPRDMGGLQLRSEPDTPRSLV
ncbi:hypothetical protein MTO96_025749 [Rhipicephalus appendiculatus]